MASWKSFVFLALLAGAFGGNWCTLDDKSCTHDENCTDADAVGYCCEGWCAEYCDHGMDGGDGGDSGFFYGFSFLGQPCDEENTCEEGLICNAGTCERDLEMQGDGCPCTSDSECLDNICIDGICEKGGRYGGEYCVAGRQCASGVCTDDACAFGTQGRTEPCDDDGQCAEGLYCISGHCYDGDGPQEGEPCTYECADYEHICSGNECTAMVERMEGETCSSPNEYCTFDTYCSYSTETCAGVGSRAAGETCDDDCACQYAHACQLNDTTYERHCVDVSTNVACTPATGHSDCGRDRYCGCAGNAFECMDGEPVCGFDDHYGPYEPGTGGHAGPEEESHGPGMSMLFECGEEFLALANLCNDGTMTDDEAFMACPDPHFASPEQLTAMARMYCCFYCNPPAGITQEELALMEMQIGRFPTMNCDTLTVDLPGTAECSATGVVAFEDRVTECDIFNAARPTPERASFSITVVLVGLSNSYYEANLADVEGIVRLEVCSLPDDDEAAMMDLVITITASYDAATGRHTFTVTVEVPSAAAATFISQEILAELGRVEDKNALLEEFLPVSARADAAVAVTLDGSATTVEGTAGTSGASDGGDSTTGSNTTAAGESGAAATAPFFLAIFAVAAALVF